MNILIREVMCKYPPPHSVCCSPLFFQLSPLLVSVTMALLFVFLPLCYFPGSFISSSAHLLSVDISLDIFGSFHLLLYTFSQHDFFYAFLYSTHWAPVQFLLEISWVSHTQFKINLSYTYLSLFYPKPASPFLFTISMSSTTVHLLI